MSIKKLSGLMTGVTLCAGFLLVGGLAYADDSVVDQIVLTLPVSCTMTGVGMTSHNATIHNNEYEDDIGTTTLTAYCNDTDGFSIYAIGYTDDTYGKTVLTDSTLDPSNDIVTGVATSGPTSNWAMKLTALSGTYTPIIVGSTADTEKTASTPNYSDYIAVPSTYDKVAYHNSRTDVGTGASGAELTTTYAAYVSPTQSAGTYVGQVKYTLVHPASAETPIVPVTIESAFLNAGKQKYNGYYKIQDMTSAICATVNQYSGDGMAEVIDVRDGNLYHIAKLADDNCWTLDNLALDPTDSTTALNMNEDNTNATQAAITNLLSGGSATTGWSSTAVADVDTDFYNGGYTVPRINNASKDTLVTSYGPASTNGQAKVGIYYNLCAVSAGTYCYASNSGVNVPDTNMDVSQDLCPVNWRMPMLDEYDVLAREYSGTAIETDSIQYNLSIPLSGYYYSDSATLQDGEYGNGMLWTSTYASNNDMEHFYSYSTYVGFYYQNRTRGLSVRCLVTE